ncbi:hypothetical protein ACEPAH_7382 [Sanghuangporus vaninii]
MYYIRGTKIMRLRVTGSYTCFLRTNRYFSTSLPRRLPSQKNSEGKLSSPISQTVVYEGPLARTFRSLKIFSLSSLGLASALTPFMFIMDTSLPFAARVVLASTALGTSGVSTALVSWCGHPYVKTIRVLSNGNSAKPAEAAMDGIQLETFTLTLRPRFTNVYDTTFLTEARRPFAKWELAESVTLQKSSEGVPPKETIAETMDAQGKVLGRWIVTWHNEGTRGTCRGEGKVQRFFNVHDELLPPYIK